MEARSMKRLLGSWFLLGIAATLDAQAQRPESKIQVFVYNYAGVSAETLARAEREAARIYSRTGIETEWLACPLTPGEAADYPACQVPVSPTRIAVRVLSRRMAERAGLSEATFGSALFPEDGGFGMVSQVCWHCVEKLAKGHEAMRGVILGHVIAHELGHLLLGIGSHGATGLMHAPWHREELERLSQGSLLFTSWEAEKMRSQVSVRLGADVEAEKHKGSAAQVVGSRHPLPIAVENSPSHQQSLELPR
jgi:hypothetical protein